ncbi:MAG: protoporphyrinogen oxidase [Opitutaceae bacterium]
MPRTCIIGAGISGLALAWQIKRKGGDCTVLEESDCVGGAMRSVRDGAYLAEEGPNSILINDAKIEDFIYSIPELPEQVVEASSEANKRFIVRNGKPHAVPMGPLSAMTTPLWSFGGKLRVLKEPFIKRIDPDLEESVADFVRRRLGDELYRYAINPLVGGIYAGDPEKLSLRYGFPKLYALEQEHGGLIRGAFAKLKGKSNEPKVRKRIITFKQGITEFPQKIAKALGKDLHTGVSIEKIERTGDLWEVSWNGSKKACFEELIITIPSHRIGELPLPKELASSLTFLHDIDYPPLSVLSLAYKRTDITHPLDGFGALVPECENRKILGALFPSSLFKGRAPADEALITVFIGGERQPELANPNTDAIMETVTPELKELLGVQGEPTFCHHKYWKQAIPQYKLGYGKLLSQISQVESAHPGLRLTGNYRAGISVTYCIEAAVNHSA